MMVTTFAVAEAARMLAENAVPWTVERFLEFPQDLYRCELLDGTLLLVPGQANEHQQVVMNLTMMFDRSAPDEWDVLYSAYVEFGPATVLRPDVVVARAGEGCAFHPQEIVMAIEVVSPSSKTRDRVLKHWMYADGGIEWYLRVELEGPHAPEVLVHRLKRGVYVEHARANAGQTLTLTEPVEVSFDPAALLQSRR